MSASGPTEPFATRRGGGGFPSACRVLALACVLWLAASALALGCGQAPKRPPVPAGARTKPLSPAEREHEQRALREAERAAGPRVMREVEEAERKLEHETEHK